MAASTNDIFQALFALAANVTWTGIDGNPASFVTMSRRVKLFGDVASQEQPALFQAEHDEAWTQKTGLPYRRELHCHWIVYTSPGRDSSVDAPPPSIEVNNIFDAIRAAVTPVTGPRLTLGGRVHHCWIEGTLFKDAGDIDGQGLIMVPFKILAP